MPLALSAIGVSRARRVNVHLSGRVTASQARALTESFRFREGTVALSPALGEALSRLATTPQAAQELYVFSDFPRELEADVANLGWFGPLAAARPVRVAAVNVAGDAGPVANVAVRGIALGTDVAAAGRPHCRGRCRAMKPRSLRR